MKNNASGIFAQRLNEALKAAGYSQSALARATGVTPQAVQRWCSGLNIPRRATVKLIAAAIDKDEAWFFSLPDKPAQSAINPGLPDGRQRAHLDEDEWQLLQAYRELPGIERRRMVAYFARRLEQFNKLLLEKL